MKLGWPPPILPGISQRTRQLIIAGLIALSVGWIVWTVVAPRIDVWRTGIRSAERAAQQVIPVEQQAQQAAHDAAAETQRVLSDYANAQQNVRALADAIAQERAHANALQAQRDALAAQVAAIEAQRIAKPKLVTLEEARRVLGTLNAVYR